MRRTSSTTDRKFMRAQALNRKEDKLLSHKITGFSKTEKQLQRELQQIQRTRLSVQQGLENLNILNSSKESLDSNRYARPVHSKRRSSTGNLLEVPKKDIATLAGAVTLPDIHPKECSVLNERNKTPKIELVKLDHVTNGDAGGQDRIPSPFLVERQPLGPRDTEVDSDGLKDKLTQRCSESFAPSYRRLRHRRQSLPALSPIVCEECERESSKGGNESENEQENESESTCAVPAKESNAIGRCGSKEMNDQNEAIRLGTCAVPSRESNAIGRRRSYEFNDQEEGTMFLDVIGRRRSKDFVAQDDVDKPNTSAVPSKESNLPERRLSSELNAIDQKQWVYARRGRRASAPVIMTQFQTPREFTQPQAYSLTPFRKTNQELLIDECLKGKFRVIGHAVIGNALLKSRRNSQNALAKIN